MTIFLPDRGCVPGIMKVPKNAGAEIPCYTTLIVCAHSAVKVKNSYFRAQFQRISAHRGSKKAYVAVAHSMLIAIYHILKDGVAFQDLGADYYNQFNKERKINACLKKLKALGWEMPESMEAQPA